VGWGGGWWLTDHSWATANKDKHEDEKEEAEGKKEKEVEGKEKEEEEEIKNKEEQKEERRKRKRDSVTCCFCQAIKIWRFGDVTAAKLPSGHPGCIKHDLAAETAPGARSSFNPQQNLCTTKANRLPYTLRSAMKTVLPTSQCIQPTGQ
jgi:hypothetical protein